MKYEKLCVGHLYIQAILIHKILTRVAGGVTEGQNLPQKWLRAREAPEWVKDP